jgi:hypothetical protein
MNSNRPAYVKLYEASQTAKEREGGSREKKNAGFAAQLADKNLMHEAYCPTFNQPNATP